MTLPRIIGGLLASALVLPLLGVAQPVAAAEEVDTSACTQFSAQPEYAHVTVTPVAGRPNVADVVLCQKGLVLTTSEGIPGVSDPIPIAGTASHAGAGVSQRVLGSSPGATVTTIAAGGDAVANGEFVRANWGTIDARSQPFAGGMRIEYSSAGGAPTTVTGYIIGLLQMNDTSPPDFATCCHTPIVEVEVATAGPPPPDPQDKCLAREGVQAVECRATWVQLKPTKKGIRVKPFPATSTLLVNWGRVVKGKSRGKSGFQRCEGSCTVKLKKGSWWVNGQIRDTPALLKSRAGIRPLVIK